MRLGPAELAVLAPTYGSLDRGSLSGGLDPVMPPAERCQVGLSMVVTGSNVVHVGGWLGTPHAVLVSGCALMAVAVQDAAPNLLPVRWQTFSST
ncbi:hypothetical protein GCM10010211_48760 [Streptomyces albospinus]|uniref:Uncharacterized protein n=1 Tax=Streptomyces albospinus TaxID=285515 RepID=A0ABQ2VAJ5_9ACTN|nr:hypothetical protein GCM10010211_48760 [Streptomyces albospinus]